MASKTTSEMAISHLEAIKTDTRDEIKRRIEQRDKYSIQLTVVLGTIIAISSSTQLTGVLIAAPLVSIYFTVLILYSYRIHKLLAQFLRNEIEPELARLCKTDPQMEWESFYARNAIPGIRKSFFIVALWVIYIMSIGYLWLSPNKQPGFIFLLGALTLVYLISTIVITKVFWKG